MKKFLLLLPLMLLLSCGSTDSHTKSETEAPSSLFLDDLLAFKNHSEVVAKFGDKAKQDTVWGPEGTFSLGTVIFKNTVDAVSIAWNDEKNMSDAILVSTTGNWDYESGKVTGVPKWETKSGLKVGMSLEDVEKLNGKPFMLSGFGWDYGGMVTDWKGGTLQGKLGLVTFVEHGKDFSEKELNVIVGDKQISSDLPETKKAKPVIINLGVGKPVQ